MCTERVGVAYLIRATPITNFAEMSRMHMIYDDRPLQQEAVKTSRWKTKWTPQDLQQCVSPLKIVDFIIY